MAKKSTDKILEVKNLTKIYDKKKVVDSISFDVYKGEIFGILGPNGAGRPQPSKCSKRCARSMAVQQRWLV